MTWYEEQHADALNHLPKDLMGKSTTKEQWYAWLKEMYFFMKSCDDHKPQRENWSKEEDYQKELSGWEQHVSMDRPNYPGYYRAAND